MSCGGTFLKLSIGLMQRYDDRPHVNCCVKNKNAATLLLSYMSDHDKITSHFCLIITSSNDIIGYDYLQQLFLIVLILCDL